MARIPEPIDKRFATTRMILDEMGRSKYPIKLRLRAILAIYSGCTRQEAADGSGVSRRTIHRWVKTWNTLGPDALTARHKRGPKRKLSRQQFDELVVPMIETPAGHQTSGWSVAEVQRKLSQKHGLEVNYITLLRAFKRNGRRSPLSSQNRAKQTPPETLLTPWPHPWPREFGPSFTDFLKMRGETFDQSEEIEWDSAEP